MKWTLLRHIGCIITVGMLAGGCASQPSSILSWDTASAEIQVTVVPLENENDD